ncbi:MAG: hypothetical protein KU38_03780 [Sulfurovum sp. FS08-3]|nr:MAG: hypothetical protein KU38_03780 [Sulfurovum sp. FS08-3]
MLETIAKDKIGASKKFRIQLDKALDNMVDFPYQYRQSIYFNNKEIREMIFKGYTIVYRIKTETQSIEIVSIFNQNKPKEVNNK